MDDRTRAPGREVMRLDFGPDDLFRLRAEVARIAKQHVPERASDLVLAVHELAVNSIVHGSGHGTLQVRDTGADLIFDVHDGHGTATEPTVGRPTPDGLAGRGMWLAQHLTDALTIHTAQDSTTVQLHVRLEPAVR